MAQDACSLCHGPVFALVFEARPRKFGVRETEVVSQEKEGRLDDHPIATWVVRPLDAHGVHDLEPLRRPRTPPGAMRTCRGRRRALLGRWSRAGGLARSIRMTGDAFIPRRVRPQRASSVGPTARTSASSRSVRVPTTWVPNGVRLRPTDPASQNVERHGPLFAGRPVTPSPLQLAGVSIHEAWGSAGHGRGSACRASSRLCTHRSPSAQRREGRLGASPSGRHGSSQVIGRRTAKRFARLIQAAFVNV
jgi:hypothetical protein